MKSQLAGVTYFVYYGPGRVIIKQNHPAYAMYFILSGEVAVSQKFYDPIFNELVTQSVGTMVAGEMFGEVSLLHDIPRTATITTVSKLTALCSFSFEYYHMRYKGHVVAELIFFTLH